MIADINTEVQQADLLASTMSNFNKDWNALEDAWTDSGMREMFYALGQTSLFDYNNPELFPNIFLMLFPRGIGGIDDAREQRIGIETQVKHLIEGSNKRFQNHEAFMFVYFNILNQREANHQIAMLVKSKSFNAMTTNITSIMVEDIAETIKNLVPNACPKNPFFFFSHKRGGSIGRRTPKEEHNGGKTPQKGPD